MLAHENPFRSERIESLAFRPQADTWPEIMDRLRAMNYRGAIVGPKGSGKTTMLEELKARLQNEGWKIDALRLSEEEPQFGKESIARICRNSDARTIILLDGAEQLGPLAWMKFQWQMRGMKGVVITIHRAGRIKPLHRTRTSPELLHDLLTELLPEKNSATDCASMLKNHNGNIRDVFFTLFGRCAGSHPQGA